MLARRPECQMLFIVAVAVGASIAIASIIKTLARDGVNDSTLGWMSAQWLAEHRASTQN